MTRREIIEAIVTEVQRTESISQNWPSDPVHAAAIVVGESSQLINAAWDHLCENRNDEGMDTVARMHKVAVQTAVMAVRFLEALPYYDGVLSDWVDGMSVDCRQISRNGVK